MADKNFAKYLFDDTDGKRYSEDICSMKGWSDKNAILEFILSMTKLLHTPNFILVIPHLQVFLQITFCRPGLSRNIFWRVLFVHSRTLEFIFGTQVLF